MVFIIIVVVIIYYYYLFLLCCCCYFKEIHYFRFSKRVEVKSGPRVRLRRWERDFKCCLVLREVQAAKGVPAEQRLQST